MLLGMFVLVAASLGPAIVAAPDAVAGAQTYQFAGTRWGASIADTTSALASRGFQLEQTAADGDLIFAGLLNERPALVVALFSQDGLTKILVSVPTEEASTLATYLEMKKILGGEYGLPEVDVETYAYPFADGKHVGFEIAALRVGKATIGAMWKTNGEALGLKVTERLIVSAHYESAAWKQEVERRGRRVGP